MIEKATPPMFSQAWHREQPPERVARTVRRFKLRAHALPAIVRQPMIKKGYDMPPEVAEQIDRDLERLLPTYGSYYPPSGRLCHDIESMTQEAAALHRDLRRYEHGTETMKARALEKMLATYARRWRGKWLGDDPR